MFSFFHSSKDKKPASLAYDPQVKTPAIRCSICTGEQVGGLRDLKTGAFEEIMMIRGSEDLLRFQQMVGQEDIPKFY